ncbi:MAG: DNA polymerase I [Erysipelotrichaceae bacterium]|jgi:DNA polymerase-1|nr:DNA polymerase I [Erysipelotrichaceae bacterium]
MKKMLLVDGYSMLFRAFYATMYGRLMTTKKGIPTNAIYGFANMLQKAIDLVEPDSIVVAFDAGKSTFRNEIYPEYKATRKPAPEELVPQFQLVRDYLDAFGIEYIDKEGLEADDIIGTLSKRYPEYEVNILTSDRDMLQLIDKTTSVWFMKKGISDIEEYDEKRLFDEYGLTPSQVIDLKGLMGDTADNIPGIPGVGEKTALKLLNEFDNVENLLKNTDKLKGKLKERVIENKELAILSKKLATIKCDVEIEEDDDDYKFKPDYKRLIDFLELVEMNSIKNRYLEMLEDTKDIVVSKYEVVKSIPDSFKNEIVSIAFDENNDEFYKAKLYGISLYNGKECVYISLKDLLNDKKSLDYLNSDSYKIGYDFKRNMHLAKDNGFSVKYDFDSMISSFLCNSTLTSLDKIMDEFGLMDVDKKADGIEYSTNFSKNIYKMYKNTVNKLKEFGLDELYYDLEIPLTYILYEMEEEGVNVDETVLDDIASKTFEQMENLTKSIHNYAGKEFNLNSPKQLGEVLFDDLNLPTNKKRSTAIDVLEKLEGFHPIISEIIEYRRLSKIYSTYAEGLKKYVQDDGKVHTVFNQSISQTGRLSSADPNLQNISVKDEEGSKVRKAFLPSKGNVLMACDYSQIELRVLADLADEKGLADAFNTNLDVHTKTAMEVFSVSEDEVDSNLRRKAKAVNFGIVYGISDFGLAKQLHISRKEAREFMDIYNERFPRIQEYMNEVIDFCKENGFVTTIFNRRRVIPQINDKNYMVREFGKRAAMNAPIQGSAADIIKQAMINIDKKMKEENLKSKMILQVHDELIFDVTLDEVEIMKELVSEGMANVVKLNVPLVVDCKVGNNWLEAK